MTHRIPALMVALANLLWASASWAQGELPTRLREQFRAGVAAERAGNLEAAEKDFRRVLDQGGDVAIVHHNLGTVYQQEGDHARAIGEFREAIRRDPEFAASHLLLGASLRATHSLADAIRELERAAQLAPEEPAVHLQLAGAYESAGRRVESVQQYRTLSALAPGDPEYQYQLGQAYLRLSQWCVSEIRRLGPQSSRMYETVAGALLAQGQTTRAIQFFQRAAQADPQLPGIHLALAQIYLGLGHTDDARREVTEELQLVPESVAAKSLLEQIESTNQKGPTK